MSTLRSLGQPAGIHYEVADDPTLVVEVEFFDLADFAVAASAKFWMSLN